MTAPTAVSAPYTIQPGAGTPAVKITDGAGNSPAGCQLVNTAANGGTIWIQAGPTGAGLLPLGPGASLTWADPAVLPYARLSAGATLPETLLVTSQSTDYSNPAAVAAATASQLAARGVPNVYTDTSLGSYRIPGGLTTAGIAIGAYGSLVVGITWPNAAPVGNGVAKLIFTDPANPDLPATIIYLTNNNVLEGTQNVYQVPIYAPQMTIKNVTNTTGDLYASISGNNRTVNELHQLGDEERFHSFFGSGLTTAETTLPDASGSGRAQSRMNGRCQIQVYTPTAGTVRAYVVGPDGAPHNAGFPVPAGDSSFDFTHPRNPIAWTFQTTPAGGSCRINVVCQD